MLNESWLLPSLLNDYITFNFHLRTVRKNITIVSGWKQNWWEGSDLRYFLLQKPLVYYFVWVLAIFCSRQSRKNQLVLNSPHRPGWPPVPLDFTVQVLGLQLGSTAPSMRFVPFRKLLHLREEPCSYRLQASENQCPPLPSVTEVHLAADGADTLFRRPFIYCDIDF